MPRPLVKIVLIVGVCLVLLTAALGIWLWGGWGFVVEAFPTTTVRSVEQIQELSPDITNLRVMNGDDEKAQALSPYQELTYLMFLGNSKLTDKGISELAKLKKLEDLTIRGNSSISNTGLASFMNFKNLKNLHLGSMGEITNEGISQLKDMKSLLSLSIYLSPKVTNEGILYLKDMENLSTLRIYQCPKVTLDVVEELKKSKPNMYVSITPQEEEAEEAKTQNKP